MTCEVILDDVGKTCEGTLDDMGKTCEVTLDDVGKTCAVPDRRNNNNNVNYFIQKIDFGCIICICLRQFNMPSCECHILGEIF